jgi:hypothetical protein
METIQQEVERLRAENKQLRDQLEALLRAAEDCMAKYSYLLGRAGITEEHL